TRARTVTTVHTCALTISVNGSGFVNGSVVNWNGASRTTTFVNSGQLQASISGTDIASAGTAQVTVFTPTPGGGTSGNSAFTINEMGRASCRERSQTPYSA